ncbi:cytochrome c biogenesis CcdA family protein [Mangrovihabitans endophyticus]|uniref:Cytochrome C biogenesis protein CcdA n=1 Tax=Mangrovihabitans endophyticus TaxID=1751298 RepID=A0A8J3C2Y8_9ACTN|nr:cytochrome c biogenesis protein CcdA [Mangrovihabitans endophyticus]GGK99756.1 cytochrome C biogenesis protein CcdA [Mangrovihabitans endophyticus]
MTEVPYALALTAGMLAAVNPCGFALLPVYLSLLTVGDDAPGRVPAVRRALLATAAMTAGFVAVFGVFGLVLLPVAGAVHAYLPWFTVVLGVAVAVAGVWLLAGRTLPGLRLPGTGRGAVTRSVPSMMLFGAGYALASLGCTVGPFLAIVVAGLRGGSPLAGAGLFVAYAVGMGLLVGVAALAVALARTSLLARMRRAAPALSRAGGMIMVVAGLYVAYYGWYETRLAGGGDPSDPVVSAAGTVQHWLADVAGRAGVTVFALLLAALTTAGLFAGWRRRTSRSTS